MHKQEDGELIPDRRVADRYGVHPLTILRWTRDEALGFPRPIEINRRLYRRRAELEAWERARVVQRANEVA
jgi:hypothetical protein